MYIIGISAYYHDSAAAILKNGELLAAAQEERFTKKKHDASFPKNALLFCLSEAEISLKDIDAIVFYDKPLLKFERLLETYIINSPKGFFSFLKSMPVWLKQKLFFKREVFKELANIGAINKAKLKILFTEHHVSHAASAFYASPFNNAAILTVDGVGEWATTTISKGHQKGITILKEIDFPHSLGLFYSSVTYYCGFKVNSGEYKLMGLAPYGDRESQQVKEYIDLFKSYIITIYKDGSVFLNQQYFKYATGLKMTDDLKWQRLFKIEKRKPEETITQQHINLALAAQIITEEIMLLLAKEAIKTTGSKNLCLAGGVALNCVANGKLVNENIAENIYIQPASGDCGGSIGAALATHYIYFNNERKIVDDVLKGAYLGPKYTRSQIESAINKFDVTFELVPNFNHITKEISKKIKEGKIIAWFQDRMEFGPRALGNRSILADPRNPNIQRKLNQSVKFRESFRPFAPSILEEYAKDYFNLSTASPFMLQTQIISKKQQLDLPKNFSSFKWEEKLNTVKSKLPAITHVDLSARIQTVNKKTNPKFHQLLTDFYLLTHCPVLVNTSFNLRGQPIVCSPDDALICFMNTNIDYLVIDNFIIKKKINTEIKFNASIELD